MARRCLWLCVVALWLLPSFGFAAPSQGDLNAARALANAGFELYEKGQYERALQRFQSAEAIYHAPPHVLFMARAHAKLGRLLESRGLYQKLVTEQLDADQPEAFRKAQASAQAELSTLDGRIPSVQVVVKGQHSARAIVTVDGEAIGADQLAGAIPLDPGEHEVKAQVAGLPEAVATVTLRDGGGVQRIELTAGDPEATTVSDPRPEPAPDDAEDSGPSIVAPVIVMSVGAALLVVGGITGGLTLSKASELKDACADQVPCDPTHESLKDSVDTFGTVSTITFVAGGAALAGGLLWLLLLPSDSPPEQQLGGITLTPYGGPRGWGVQGTF